MAALDHITIDFETYSEAGYVWSSVKSYTQGGKPKGGWLPVKKGQTSGIAAVGAWRYAEHPSTEVLSLDYDGTLWVPGMPPPQPLFDHIAAGGMIEAHNSFFEYVIWLFVCRRMGWPALPLAQMRCTMSRANAYGLPGALAKVCDILKLPIQKDKDGAAIMRKVSKPRDPTLKDLRTRYTPLDEPEMFKGLYSYNQSDTAAERAASARLPHLSAFELEVWKLDQRINVRGVATDLAAIRGGRKIIDDLAVEKLAELVQVTNGFIETAGQVAKLREFLNLHGVHLDDMTSDTVDAALERPDLPAIPRKVLELRQALSLASVKKLVALDNRTADDGRAHDLFTYAGAVRTQRWTSEAAQLHNLSKKGPPVVRCERCAMIQKPAPHCSACGSLWPAPVTCEWGIDAMEQCLIDIAQGDIAQMRARWGDDVALAISGSVRGMLIAGPGYEFIGTDYDNIEARVLAVVAGEEWRIEVFRGDGKIYERTAAQVTGVPLAEILAHKEKTGQHHPSRNSIGKVAELASGFQGALGAWLKFGAGNFMSDEEITAAIKTWRADNPMIVALWYRTQECFEQAVARPGVWHQYRFIGYYYNTADDCMYCRLPSGRYLYYHEPRLTPNQYGKFDISYMKKAQTGGAWVRTDSYGGMLVENFTQAIARDFMAWGMLQLDARGYTIALHVHDEPVAEVLEGTGSVEEMAAILTDVKPPWALDWPISASGGWRGKRFRKD